MDAYSLALRHVCNVCGKLPEHPYAAEDGYFYHKGCIEGIFERAAATEVINSPVTGRPMGKRLIFAKTVQCVIEKLVSNNEEVKRKLVHSDSGDAIITVRATKDEAREGSAKHMALLGRWHLFGEQDGMECNLAEGYQWCQKAVDKGDVDGMAYQAICLLHGYAGIKKDRNEGFELLVDAANEGSAYAAYKLGSFYYTGLHGFKEDRKRASKWLKRAESKLSELNESERRNVCNYLSTISSDSAPSTMSTCRPSPVPEQIDVKNDCERSMSTIGMASAGRISDTTHPLTYQT